jgi:hypothetical protein
MAAILAYILVDRFVRMKLFPSPGQNVSSAEGGGKPKTWAYWLIVRNCLGKMSEYADAIQLLVDNDNAEARNAWVTKMKNLLTRYVSL